MPAPIPRILRDLEDRGLSRSEALDVLRTTLGSRRFKLAVAQLDASDANFKRLERARKRETRADTLWQQLAADMHSRAKYAARMQTDGAPYFKPYYEAVTQVLERACLFLEQHRLRASQRPGPLLTPAAYASITRNEGVRLGTGGKPPGGDMWLDWIPAPALEALERLAQECIPVDQPMVRLPRMFKPRRTDTEARRMLVLKLTLEGLQEDVARNILGMGEEMGALVPGATEADSGNRFPELSLDNKRSLLWQLMLHHVSVMAQRELDRWPRTRRLPVDPMHIVGTKKDTLHKAMVAVPDWRLDGTPAASLSALALDVATATVSEAQTNRADRLARAAKRKPRKKIAAGRTRSAIVGAEKLVGDITKRGEIDESELNAARSLPPVEIMPAIPKSPADVSRLAQQVLGVFGPKR